MLYENQITELIITQATFVALNIEPDDDSEEEIDDSKEIQVRDHSEEHVTPRQDMLTAR